MSDSKTLPGQDEHSKAGEQNTAPDEKNLLLFFASNELDATDKPKGIANLEVTLKGGKTTHKLRTNFAGELPVATFSGDTAICQVSVTLPNGNEEDLGEIVLYREDNAHTYISPYTVKKTVTEHHVGEPPKKSDKKAPAKKTRAKTKEDVKKADPVGEVTNTRNDAGHPVTLITAQGECYDKANTRNLKLEGNVIYRDFLIKASDRSGIIPQAIATLISIEAGGTDWTVTVTVPPEKMTDEEAAQEAKVKKDAEAADAAAAKKDDDAIAASKQDKTKKGLAKTRKLENQAKKNAKARAKKSKDEEAARIKRAQPAIVRKVFTIWNPDAKNVPKDYPNTAAGLTQFLAKTWVGEATTKGTFLSDAAIKAGWVKEVPNPPTKKKGKLIPLTDAEKKHNAEAAKVNAHEKDKAKHIKLIQPKHEIITEPGKGAVLQVVNLGKLYDMRFDPEVSIMTSIDYAMQNLKQLSDKYSAVSSLNDANKAKLIYLSHHLGFGDCVKFINNKIEAEDKPVLKNGKPVLNKHKKPVMILGAESLLRAQFKKNPKQAEAWYIKNGKNWIWAHRSWLINLIDSNVNIKNFACDKSSVPNSDLLFDIIINLGGEHPEDFKVVVAK